MKISIELCSKPSIWKNYLCNFRYIFNEIFKYNHIESTKYKYIIVEIVFETFETLDANSLV